MILIYNPSWSNCGEKGKATPPIAGPSAPPAKPRRSVAVLGFKNLSERQGSKYLSIALSEMFTTELAAGENLRTIPGENVAQMKINLALSDAGSFSRETLAQIRRNLSADLVVLGSYLATGDQASGMIRLDLRVQDAAQGETIASVAETGTRAKLFNLVSEAGAQLREKLGVGKLSSAQGDILLASFPKDPDAARLYSEGLAKLRLFDALGARDLLEKAIVADPNFPLSHSALAAAWSILGYDGKARVEAERAFALSASLSREDRLSAEGMYRESTREWEKAIEVYRGLWDFFPDNLEYGLRLAAA